MRKRDLKLILMHFFFYFQVSNWNAMEHQCQTNGLCAVYSENLMGVKICVQIYRISLVFLNTKIKSFAKGVKLNFQLLTFNNMTLIQFNFKLYKIIKKMNYEPQRHNGVGARFS